MSELKIYVWIWMSWRESSMMLGLTKCYVRQSMWHALLDKRENMKGEAT